MSCFVAYVCNGELVSLIGNQRVGIFPPKSEILFVLSLALIWCRNFQDRTIPVGGDTWPSFWRQDRRRRTRYTSARQYVMPCESGRRSRDHRPTVKQRFLDVSSNLGNFWKKSLNGHATVVEVTRPSADCQTTFFGRLKRFGKILKKVAERSRDSGSGHATVGRLSNNDFSTFQAIRKFFEKSRWTVTRQWSRSRDRRPTVKQRFWMFQAIGKFFEISHWTVTRQWSEVTPPSADCQTTFLDVSSN